MRRGLSWLTAGEGSPPKKLARRPVSWLNIGEGGSEEPSASEPENFPCLLFRIERQGSFLGGGRACHTKRFFSFCFFFYSYFSLCLFMLSFFDEVVALLGWKGGRKVKLFASSQGVCFLTLRL